MYSQTRMPFSTPFQDPPTSCNIIRVGGMSLTLPSDKNMGEADGTLPLQVAC
jgi:hypothetical protein